MVNGTFFYGEKEAISLVVFINTCQMSSLLFLANSLGDKIAEHLPMVFLLFLPV